MGSYTSWRNGYVFILLYWMLVIFFFNRFFRDAMVLVEFFLRMIEMKPNIYLKSL